MVVRRWFDILVAVVLVITLVLTVQDALATAGCISKFHNSYGRSERTQEILYPDKEIGR